MPPPSERPAKSIPERREASLFPTHFIRTKRPEREPVGSLVTIIPETDRVSLSAFETDEARFPGGKARAAVKFHQGSGVAEISDILSRATPDASFVAQGARTSLTGAAVPKEDIVLDMSERKKISPIETNAAGERFITVESGVTFDELEHVLQPDGLFFPSAPTYKSATIGGAVSTDAGGARSEKYGKMRKNVQALTMVLDSGDVLEVERGQYKAHPKDETSDSDYFELVTHELTDEGVTEVKRRIPVPTYTMPDVPKLSAGYYATSAKPGESHGMDLIDLIVGSEGTFGVITDVKLKVYEEPPTAMALVQCNSDEQAMQLMAALRDNEPAEMAAGAPGGFSAIEFMGREPLQLVRDFGTNFLTDGELTAHIPDGAKSLVLVQLETTDGKDPDGTDSPTTGLFNLILERVGIEDFAYADPKDDTMKKKFVIVREAIPLTVNDRVTTMQRTVSSKITKVGADPCVKPELIPALMNLYDEEFGSRGLKWFPWGHGKAGNIHCNIVSESETELALARQAMAEVNRRVIEELGGAATAEHGVGMNPSKQAALRISYGDEGIEEMAAVRRAFNPKENMAPGNIIPLQEAA